MTIELPNGQRITSDGTHWHLPDGSGVGQRFSGFNDMAFALVKAGIIQPDQQHIDLIECGRGFARCCALMLLACYLRSHAYAASLGAMVFVADGRFVVAPTGNGVWTLVTRQPGYATLDDDVPGFGRIVIGQCPTLEYALELALVREFHHQDGCIPWSELGRGFTNTVTGLLAASPLYAGVPKEGNVVQPLPLLPGVDPSSLLDFKLDFSVPH